MATLKFLSNPGPSLRVYGYSLGGTGTLSPVGYPATQIVELFHTAEITGLSGKFFLTAIDSTATKRADMYGVNLVDADVVIDIASDGDSSSVAALNDITRPSSDAQPIRFQFPNDGATITATKSINGAGAVGCAGAVSPIDNGLPGYWYQLAYDQVDRAAFGNVIYTFTDGDEAVRVLLLVENETKIDAIVSSSATAAAQSTAAASSAATAVTQTTNLPKYGDTLSRAKVSATKVQLDETITKVE